MSIAAKSKINLENAPKFKLNFDNLKNDNNDNDNDSDNAQEDFDDDEEDDAKEIISNIFLKNYKNNHEMNINNKKNISNNNNKNNNNNINNNANGGAKTHRPIKNKIGINQNNFFNNNNKINKENIKNKIKYNCMSSRYIYDKNPLLNDIKIKGNLTERISNNNNKKQIINKKAGPKTQREIMIKKNKISKKDFHIIDPKKLNNNIGFIKEKMKKENMGNKSKNDFDKKSNAKLGKSNINMIYNQRPNSSRVNANKDDNNKLNNLIKNNNIIDKIFNDNKRYFGFPNHPMNVNINSNSSLSSNKPISTRINNITHGKNIGQFIKIMKPQKAYQ